MDIRHLDRRALETIDKIIADAHPNDLDRPTPCAAWNLRDLLRHQISENTAFSIALREGAAADWESGARSTDVFRDYAESVTAVLGAIDAEGTLERPVSIHEFGPFPGRIAVSMHLVDSVVHGWDIAKTLGVPYQPDPDAVHEALLFAEKIPADPETRGPDASFDLVVPVGADASELERLLGLVGRSPGWAPPR
ncbi:TIGR03086 family metal-binding protein [Amycolatopsis anabasis]|uniref:TIGR03086 family metal-binding protein n=1 Tax=Amycolatopsis anabasis TaxID=1840409 RepID=UPI00131D0FEB|nr:TIGR03086 family metal-binding protein [Amycolatopsis anabasis]